MSGGSRSRRGLKGLERLRAWPRASTSRTYESVRQPAHEGGAVRVQVGVLRRRGIQCRHAAGQPIVQARRDVVLAERLSNWIADAHARGRALLRYDVSRGGRDAARRESATCPRAAVRSRTGPSGRPCKTKLPSMRLSHTSASPWISAPAIGRLSSSTTNPWTRAPAWQREFDARRVGDRHRRDGRHESRGDRFDQGFANPQTADHEGAVIARARHFPWPRKHVIRLQHAQSQSRVGHRSSGCLRDHSSVQRHAMLELESADVEPSPVRDAHAGYADRRERRALDVEHQALVDLRVRDCGGERAEGVGRDVGDRRWLLEYRPNHADIRAHENARACDGRAVGGGDRATEALRRLCKGWLRGACCRRRVRCGAVLFEQPSDTGERRQRQKEQQHG